MRLHCPAHPACLPLPGLPPCHPLPLPAPGCATPAAYFLVAGNDFSNGGTTAFAAGQGTGFEFMTAPWIQYEAYDIKAGHDGLQ